MKILAGNFLRDLFLGGWEVKSIVSTSICLFDNVVMFFEGSRVFWSIVEVRRRNPGPHAFVFALHAIRHQTAG